MIDQIIAEELAFHSDLEPVSVRAERLRLQLTEFAQEFRARFSEGLQALGYERSQAPSLEQLMEWDQTARKLYAEGSYCQARDAFFTIVASAPQYSAFWAGFAHALISCGEEERGLQAAKACLDLNPELPNGYLACARAYLQGNAIASALAICDQGLNYAHTRLAGKTREHLIQTLSDAKFTIQLKR